MFARNNPFAIMITLMSINPTAHAGWHDWSQSSRNDAIVDEDEWGDQCKIWVQQYVVTGASGLWLIPSNSSNVCYWNYGAHVVGRSGYIEYAPSPARSYRCNSAHPTGRVRTPSSL